MDTATHDTVTTTRWEAGVIKLDVASSQTRKHHATVGVVANSGTDSVLSGTTSARG